MILLRKDPELGRFLAWVQETKGTAFRDHCLLVIDEIRDEANKTSSDPAATWGEITRRARAMMSPGLGEVLRELAESPLIASLVTEDDES